jgi:hypothetical protein
LSELPEKEMNENYIIARQKGITGKILKDLEII